MTMTHLTITLPENLKAFVEDQVASGRYGTASDYIRGLLLEALERKGQEELEAKLLAALDEEPVEMGKEDWEQLRAQVRQAASERQA
jgi:antitoxin ParD1/3/4